MSIVWRATDEVLRRPVAVKILARNFSFDLARAAVLTEAQAVAQLSHANICNVFDYGESLQPDGRMVPYIVMELLTGPSLHDRLKDGPVAPAEALKIAAEVAAGLGAAHAHGVVHRDVKPGNVILTPGGAKVIDFGIAASTGSPDVEPDGSIRATLSCVAPERLLGGTAQPPSDMFSFGVLLFNLLAGHPPWPQWVSLQDRLALAAPLPALPGVPASIGELYRSCLSQEPEDRPTAAAAAAVLLVALAVRTPQASDVAPSGRVPDRDSEAETLGLIALADRRRRRRTATVLGVGLVAALAGAVFAIANNPGRGGDVLGAGPSAGASTAPTVPSDIPMTGIPGREVPVPGVGGQPVTVYVTVPVPGGGNQLIQQSATFTTQGGSVVAVCDPYGPRVTDVMARPGYYPNDASLIVRAYVFFTKPGDGASPAITYRLTISCPTVGGEPQGTVTSYIGDKLVTPSPSPPTTTAPPSPSA
jgi:serine/threonine-protein kinase